MTVDALMAQLAAADVVLSVDGERLLFDAPAGALTPELRAALAAQRAELVRRLSPGTASAQALIAAEPAAAAGRFANWILRPDATGKFAWEAPDVPEASRWWARSTFDALPTWPQPHSPPNTNCLRLP